MQNREFRATDVKLEFDEDALPQAPRGDIDEDSVEKQRKIRFRQDTKHRHQLIVWMMVLISVWLCLVIAAVFLNGPLGLGISDTVLVTLLATTTANVLGLPSIILRDLFKGRRT